MGKEKMASLLFWSLPKCFQLLEVRLVFICPVLDIYSIRGLLADPPFHYVAGKYQSHCHGQSTEIGNLQTVFCYLSNTYNTVDNHFYFPNK